MTKKINKLILITICFNFLILIGYGHGIGFLGLFELGIWKFLTIDVQFSLTGNYDDRLFTSAIISLIGQIVLLMAYYKKALLAKYKTIYAGLFILFFSFVILTIHLFDSGVDSFSFWAGMPFLITGIMLLIRTIKNHRLLLMGDEILQQ